MQHESTLLVEHVQLHVLVVVIGDESEGGAGDHAWGDTSRSSSSRSGGDDALLSCHGDGMECSEHQVLSQLPSNAFTFAFVRQQVFDAAELLVKLSEGHFDVLHLCGSISRNPDHPPAEQERLLGLRTCLLSVAHYRLPLMVVSNCRGFGSVTKNLMKHTEVMLCFECLSSDSPALRQRNLPWNIVRHPWAATMCCSGDGWFF